MRQFWSNRLMPPWAIPIVMIVSLILAVVLHHFVGEPLRKKLRAPESTSTVKASTGIIVN